MIFSFFRFGPRPTEQLAAVHCAIHRLAEGPFFKQLWSSVYLIPESFFRNSRDICLSLKVYWGSVLHGATPLWWLFPGKLLISAALSSLSQPHCHSSRHTERVNSGLSEKLKYRHVHWARSRPCCGKGKRYQQEDCIGRKKGRTRGQAVWGD